jgi:hypothetical protein
MRKLFPSLKEWKNLYQTAIEFKKIESWKWMNDTDLFGVQNPKSKEIGYCCILGSLGEFFSLNVYLGSRGLQGYLKIQSGQIEPGDIESLNVQDCLSASFTDKNDLRDKDLETIKKLGLKFRGKNNWPLFRRYEPGFYPWYIDKGDAKFLILALKQAKEVALQVKENKDLLTLKHNLLLVRIPEKKGKKLIWKEEWIEPAPPQRKEVIIPEVDEERIEGLRNEILRKEGCWEVDFFFSPFTIQEKKDERPYYPYACLFLDHKTWLIIGSEISNHSEYKKEFQDRFLSIINENNIIPEEVLVKRDIVYRLFRPITRGLDIKIKMVKRLEGIKEAQYSMIEYMMKNPPPDF